MSDDNYVDDEFEPTFENIAPATAEPSIPSKGEKPQSIIEWERWRMNEEMRWREELRTKEMRMRELLEEQVRNELKEKSDEIKKAYEGAAKLEIRLKSAIDAVERQKAKLLVSEEQVGQRLAQKTAELQLLQRRVRDEAKIKVEDERRRADVLQRQLEHSKSTIERLNRL